MSRSGCVPYSAAACEAAAEKLGFDKGGHGYAFQGNYNPKGCYAYKSGTYKGHVYFGTGGTDLQKKEYVEYWRNEHHIFRPQGDDCATGCAPLSADACKAAADRIGFGKGGHDHDFQGNYNPKGCYAYKSGTYKGHVYFGTGGTEQQMKEDINESDKFRPQGDDCYKVGKDECVTVGGPKSPSKCVFPFKYGGKTYNECEPSGAGSTPWCATKTDANGEYIKGEYGRCNAGVICGSNNTSGTECDRAHVVKVTTKYIEDEVTSGSATEKMNKIKDFLDSHYPSCYYAIVVQGNSGGFCASGSISSKKTWDNDIYMRSGGSAIVVAISAYKSTCQLSEISTGTSWYGLGQNITKTEKCWRYQQIPIICENFKHYRTKHTVTMYALFLSGAAKTYKGLYPCQGRVECDGGTECSGGFLMETCTDVKQTTLFFAVNQWKCDVKSNGRPSTGDKDCVFQA